MFPWLDRFDVSTILLQRFHRCWLFRSKLLGKVILRIEKKSTDYGKK